MAAVQSRQTHHMQQPQATQAPAEPAQPAMLRLDFASNPSLRQVTTMLRRAWLLADPGAAAAADDDKDRDAVQERLRAACGVLGADITTTTTTTTTTGDDDKDGEGGGKWDHDAWVARASSQLKLDVLGAPVVVAGPGPGAADSKQDDAQRSVVSPWREEIYEVYRHVFVDLWRVLVATAAGAGVGRYDPSRGDAVSVVVLPLPAAAVPGAGDEEEMEKKEKKKEKDTEKAERTAFRTDTFLFPVWVSPRAEVSFAAAPAAGEEEEVDDAEGGAWAHAWAAGEASTWTTGLWVREGREVEITTRVVGASVAGQDGGEGEEGDGTGVAAVFVTGHCEQKGEQQRPAGHKTSGSG